MMEDLYFEKFSRKAKEIEAADFISHNFKPPEPTNNKSRELIYQITIFIDQLDKWVKEYYKDDEGILYLVAKIKKKIAERSFEDVITELTNLEELFDLVLPFFDKYKKYF